jgi:c-di-GMP-related signal transduction protein
VVPGSVPADEKAGRRCSSPWAALARITVKKFVARQPIFDNRMKIYGYELLFRSGLEPYFQCEDPDLATASVVVDSFLLFGMKMLTGGRRAFINFTYNLLINDYAKVLPSDQVVIEILESVPSDDRVVAACRDLRARGYMLALDDYGLNLKHKPLLGLVDIVKVDFRLTTSQHRQEMVLANRDRGIKFLAEKVETRSHYEEARQLGYSLFQGYFFGKPETLESRDIPAYKHNHYHLLQAVHQPQPNLAALEDIIKHETSLSYKLLRYLNSAAFAFCMEIRSIRHALAILGLNEVRKWVSVVALAGAAKDKPSELIITSMVRARFAELLAPEAGLPDRASEFFLMGLLSMMDAILGRPLADILAEVPITADIKAALLNGSSPLRPIHEFVQAYERGDWDEIVRRSKDLRLNESKVTEAYLAAADWANQTYQISAAA